MLRSIQVLRGIAACSVVLLHCVPSFRLGAAGVDLFFVISGFIMANVSQGRTPKQFLIARLWRIYPLWLIAVAPWIFWTHPDLPRLITSLTLWPIIHEWQTPALRVGWTLSFEMLFYVAMAVSLRVGSKPVLGLFGLSLVGAFFLRWPIFNYLGNPMIFEFLMGVVIARMPRLPDLTWPLLLFALGALAFSPTWIGDVGAVTLHLKSVWRVLYWGVPAALVVYACLSSEQWFDKRWLIPLILGDASYSIYLFHPALVELPLPWFLKFVVAVAGGVLAWWLIERRLLLMRNVLGRFDQRHVSAISPAAGEIERDCPAGSVRS